MKILGIETSCDETGVALYDTEWGLLADALYSQVDIHAEYGGVVPELASRDHVRKTLPLIDQVLTEGGITRGDIDGVAYTAGPWAGRRPDGGCHAGTGDRGGPRCAQLGGAPYGGAFAGTHVGGA